MKGALAVVLPVYREVRNRRCCAGFKPPKACDGKRSLDALPGRRFLRPAALAEVPRACYDEGKARPAALMKRKGLSEMKQMRYGARKQDGRATIR